MSQKSSTRLKNQSYIRGAYMNVSYDAPPLDFSFKEIENLSDLLFEKQRKGRSKDRKPIIEQKVDKKKKGQKEKEKEDYEESMDGELEVGDSEGDNEESKDDEGEDKKKKDEFEVNKLIPPSNHLELTNQHNISLAPNQHGVSSFAQNKDAMGKSKKKKVKLVCSSLILMANKIPDLKGFHEIVDQVMVDCFNLRWIDLSHNSFSKLTSDFGKFPFLKCLYLHCNRIRDMNELCHLKNIQQLRTLTIHGNPLDQLPNFRIYILGLLPELKKLDTVLCTHKEKDNARVWRDQFHQTSLPCAPEEDEDLKKDDEDDQDMP